MIQLRVNVMTQNFPTVAGMRVIHHFTSERTRVPGYQAIKLPKQTKLSWNILKFQQDQGI